MAKHKKGQAAVIVSSRGIAQPYLATVLSIFETNPTITPRTAWTKFQELHPPLESNSSSYPSKGKVKSKISSLKSKNKI